MRKKRERELIAAERNRYAREIHDQLAQNLTAISLNLNLCKSLLEKKPEKAGQIINNCLDLINKSSEELKYTIFEPAALANAGLINSIKKQIEIFKQDINFTVLSHGKEKMFPLEQELVIWRIFSEILVNTIFSGQVSEKELPVSMEILFDFSEILPFLVIKISGVNLDFSVKPAESAKTGLSTLIRKSEEQNLKIKVAQDNKDTIIKINL